MMLVTLEIARAQIRSDIADDDAWLTAAIEDASDAVINYLKNPAFADSSGEIPVDSSGVAIGVPGYARRATLFLIGYFQRQRDEDPNKEFDSNTLPRPVKALLLPYRVPTIGVPTRRHTWPWC